MHNRAGLPRPDPLALCTLEAKKSQQRHRLQMSRNLRDSPGFVEFVPGPGRLCHNSRIPAISRLVHAHEARGASVMRRVFVIHVVQTIQCLEYTLYSELWADQYQ